jgi:hypothetical protein
MKTIQEHIDSLKSEFGKLSASRRATLRRNAEKFIRQAPHMADANGFWRGLSARQVIEA